MNATSTATRPIASSPPRLGLEKAISRPLPGSTTLHLWERVQGVPRRRWIAMLVLLAVASVAIIGVSQGARQAGYLGVFAFSVIANATLFIPSGRGAVMLAGAFVLNPLAVAVLTGVGGAVGEMTGYAVGRSSRRVNTRWRLPAWFTRSAENHMAATILVVSIIPNPFVDAIGIVAGRIGYPLRLFLAYSMIGKVIQSIVFVYVAIWNVSLVMSWIA